MDSVKLSSLTAFWILAQAVSVAQLSAADSGNEMSHQGRILRYNVVKTYAEVGAKSFGFGFHVAQRGSEHLYVTAAHNVTYDGGIEADHVELSFFLGPDDLPIVASGKLLRPYSPKEKLDIAFVSVALPPEATVVPAGTADHLIRLGDRVSFVGQQQKWGQPAEIGLVSKLTKDGQVVEFRGIQVLEGSSGSPLFSRSGIIALVRTARTSAVASGTTIAPIKRFFDSHYLDDGWTWKLQRAGYSPPLGALRISRVDPLNDVLIDAVGGGHTFPVSQLRIEVPEGRYELRHRPLKVTKGPPRVECTPSEFEVVANQETALGVACAINAEGVWTTSDGREIQLSHKATGGYLLEVRSRAGVTVGRGDARILNGTTLNLNVNQSTKEPWTAKLTLSPDLAMGKAVLISKGLTEVPFTMER